jgi:hypothetical protein
LANSIHPLPFLRVRRTCFFVGISDGSLTTTPILSFSNHKHLVESKINDFKKIQGWTSGKHNDVHAKEAAWLHDQVVQAAREKRRILVATHHAPCVDGTSKPSDSSNPWTSAFATDLLDQPGWDHVRLWVFGHTHYSTDMLRNGIRLVANQRGYVLPGSSTENPAGKTTRKKNP